MPISLAPRLVSALFCFALAGLHSCTDVLDVQPKSYQLTATELALQHRPFSGGQLAENINLSATPIPFPMAGNNQVWDFSNVASRGNARFNGSNVSPQASTGFPNATFERSASSLLLVPGNTTVRAQVISSFQLAEDGYYRLGVRYPNTASSPIAGYPGSLATLPAQTVVYRPRQKSISLPGFYGRKDSLILRDTVKAIISIPSLNLNNVVLDLITETQVRQDYIGAGTVILKNFGSRNALLYRDYVKYTNFYLVNGQPAPASLLMAMDYIQGEVSEATTFLLFAEGLGLAVEYLIDSSGRTLTQVVAVKKS